MVLFVAMVQPTALENALKTTGLTFVVEKPPVAYQASFRVTVPLASGKTQAVQVQLPGTLLVGDKPVWYVMAATELPTEQVDPQKASALKAEKPGGALWTVLPVQGYHLELRQTLPVTTSGAVLKATLLAVAEAHAAGIGRVRKAGVGEIAPAAPSDLKASLEASGLPFQTLASGRFQLQFTHADGRKQTVFVEPKPEEYRSLRFHEIYTFVWKGEGEPSESVLEKLLRERKKLGGFRFERDSDGKTTRLYFSVWVDADASPKRLADTIRFTEAVGDELEKALNDGKDQW